MTLTSTLDLDSIKMNQHAKYVSRMSFSSKLIVYTNTYTETHTQLATALPGPLKRPVIMKTIKTDHSCCDSKYESMHGADWRKNEMIVFLYKTGGHQRSVNVRTNETQPTTCIADRHSALNCSQSSSSSSFGQGSSLLWTHTLRPL